MSLSKELRARKGIFGLAMTVKQRLSMKLATKRINIWEGAVRSGKTVGSIVHWIRYIRNAPKGAELLMVGKTERTLKRNIIDVMVNYLGAARCRYIAGKGELWVLGRLVYVCGANDESAQEKIRGLTLAGAYGDEVSIWPESFFTMLLSRLSVKGSKFFGTTNPDNPVHWLKKLIDRAAVHLTAKSKVVRRKIGTKTRKGEVINWARFTFILRDNPFLPEEYIRSLESEYTGLWYRRFILGHWVAAEGSVYPMWDPDLHVVHDLPPLTEVYSMGIDYGSTNPTAGIMLGLGTDRRLYAFGEWAPRSGDITDGELTASLRDHLEGVGRSPRYFFPDPAAKSLKVQMKRDGFSPIKNAHNEPVNDGIRVVANLIAGGQLKIHASCESLLDEIPGYAWDPKATEKGEDKVLKVNDHFCDALRYAVYSSRVLWRNAIREREVNHAASEEQFSLAA